MPPTWYEPLLCLFFLLILVSQLLVVAGLIVYMVRFWRQDFTKSIKERRLPRTSMLIDTGVELMAASIVVLIISIMVLHGSH